MRRRKIPMRKDVVTGKMAPKKKLIRIVRQKDRKVFVDETGKQSGRGAYIGMSIAEAKKAKADHILDKTFSVKLDDRFYDKLIKYADHEQARQELFNHDK